MNFNDFNALSTERAMALLRPCVAIPAWAEQVVAARPYASHTALLAAAQQAAQGWQAADLTLALSAHPRIGERAAGPGAEAAFSRREQAGVDAGAPTAAALRAGNLAYEQRFGRVFLVRAKGRSAEEMLAILHQRLANSPAQEQQESLEQLRQITLLRLEELITP
ncbi:OHCU decarboxylase [Chimaeribacter arupi]|uniref:2-oxo-4-hydroxy-4-carboxy-5-ureidoimidazoline decarboxylase n=1 Tax=Chimaeribacter arupi TaxID=2060066 RepID=UPI000C79F023|nr:2-oxo-4-hydroxy-4-carboxy-5-ureidoimidazoline decarboxylase [Chimaeribacter arupi]PLR44613.1 OHCU decarboxylase [Chimaeribacter arupi]